MSDRCRIWQDCTGKNKQWALVESLPRLGAVMCHVCITRGAIFHAECGERSNDVQGLAKCLWAKFNTLKTLKCKPLIFTKHHPAPFASQVFWRTVLWTWMKKDWVRPPALHSFSGGPAWLLGTGCNFTIHDLIQERVLRSTLSWSARCVVQGDSIGDMKSWRFATMQVT